MFTILIPVLKQGFLQSQLVWLSKQTFKDFTVIAMDSFYQNNRYQSWVNKEYPFKFVHLPLLHDVRTAKRCDYSIKNNLALLAPTNHFVFLSDTHYVVEGFAEKIAKAINDNKSVVFDSTILLYSAYDGFTHKVDSGGQTTHYGKPIMLFDRKMFFYILNGFDEATTMAYEREYMLERFVNTGEKDIIQSHVFHILHSPDNEFGKIKQSCERCSTMFPRWKFATEEETGSFPLSLKDDKELFEQFTFIDPVLGLKMFECPNCGFCGCIENYKYKKLIMDHKITEAPKKMFDGRLGRDMGELYEKMNKVNNDYNSKMAFLKTSYY